MDYVNGILQGPDVWEVLQGDFMLRPTNYHKPTKFFSVNVLLTSVEPLLVAFGIALNTGPGPNANLCESSTAIHTNSSSLADPDIVVIEKLVSCVWMMRLSNKRVAHSLIKHKLMHVFCTVHPRVTPGVRGVDAC